MKDLLLAENISYYNKSIVLTQTFNYVSILFAFFYSLTLLFGILTNLLVVIVFICRSELRQYTNYFFANLSIADILVIIVCIPVAISDTFSPDVWQFGHLYCKMYYFIEYCVTSVSSLTIIFISLERFFAISKPLYVKLLFNEKNSLLTIALIWLLGIFVSTPFIFMTEFTSDPAQCQLIMNFNHLIYVFILNIVLIFIPTLGLTFLYIFIIINLRKHYKLFTKSSNPESNGKTLRIHSKSDSVRKKQQSQNVKSSSSVSCSDQINSNSINNKKKIFRSCSFCFTSLNKKYECRCNIGNHDIPLKYLNNNSTNTKKCSLNNKLTVKLINNKVKFKLTRSDSISNKINFTIVISLVTLAFFCCQLPIRIFLLWSYLKHYFEPIYSNNQVSNINDLNLINIISYMATLIYFLHCLSNPIIYNILSNKFRKAFLNLGISNKNSCKFKLTFKLPLK